MQPGQPGPGQDPNNPNPSDPFGQPGYGQPTYQQPGYGQPGTGDPYAPPQYGTPPYPPAGGYPGGGYAVPGMPPGQAGASNTQGLLAMIFGIASIPLGVCCGILGMGLGVAAVVLGNIGLSKARQGAATNRGMALAGMICGAVGLALWLIITIVLLATHSYRLGTTP